MRLIIAAAAAALLSWATPGWAQAVSIKDPKAFSATLKAMGYEPTPITKADTIPEFDIDIEGFVSTLRMQGCTEGRDCRYVTLVASYSDVIRPPQAWMQKMNDEFDLLRVGTNDSGQLYMFGAYVLEGLPRSELKRILDYWGADTAAIAQEAIEEGYTTTK